MLDSHYWIWEIRERWDNARHPDWVLGGWRFH